MLPKPPSNSTNLSKWDWDLLKVVNSSLEVLNTIKFHLSFWHVLLANMHVLDGFAPVGLVGEADDLLEADASLSSLGEVNHQVVDASHGEVIVKRTVLFTRQNFGQFGT